MASPTNITTIPLRDLDTLGEDIGLLEAGRRIFGVDLAKPGSDITAIYYPPNTWAQKTPEEILSDIETGFAAAPHDNNQFPKMEEILPITRWRAGRFERYVP